MKRKLKKEENYVRFRKEEERKAKDIQWRQECTREKRVSSVSRAGQTGQLHVKE